MFKSTARPASSLARRATKTCAVQNATFNTSAPLHKLKRVELDSTIFTLNNGVKVPAVAFQSDVTRDIYPKNWKPRFNGGWRHIDISSSFNPKNYLIRSLWDLASVTRDELFISSKLECYKHHDPHTSLLHHMRGIRTGYLDLWLLKFPVSWRSPEDKQAPIDKGGNVIDYVYAWKQMEKAYEAKKVRAIGICNFSKAELEKLLRHAQVMPAVHQMELTPYLQQKEFVKFNKDHGITISSYSYLNQTTISGDRKSLVERLLADPVLNRIALKHRLTPTQTITAWHVSRGEISVPFVHLSDIEATRGMSPLRGDKLLDPEDIEEINGLDIGARMMYPRTMGYIPFADLEGVPDDADKIFHPQSYEAMLLRNEREAERKRIEQEKKQALIDSGVPQFGTRTYTGKLLGWVRSVDEPSGKRVPGDYMYNR
ncbi:hypothetical protein DRE_03181 [Drechslerella stenobrocha 248]|uniref:NADP-dependent oxidoreductase domain-containing protein n=1 Tax=Drechslerella stenobrocha 248 TaxID=1043628 RepID=W7HTT9_9PEZI|nr:hypothetical protein DRE_03181 [Drechslerella stenobrocha 248]